MVFDNNKISEFEFKYPRWRTVLESRSAMSHGKIIDKLNEMKTPTHSLVSWFNLLGESERAWICSSRYYDVPTCLNGLAIDISELSLTHNIIGLNIRDNNRIDIAFVEATDGTSNIDVDVIEKLIRGY